jgi:branched-subunit amino acid aminotransferase/4-amino-4-deoxychorismate lyase
MATVWLNGKFVSMRDAKVSAFDAGFTHAVGVFETLLGGNGAASPEGQPAPGSNAGPWAISLTEHMERLRDSAAELGLAEHVNTAALADAVLEAIEESALPRARVRLTFSGGDLNMLGRSWDKAKNAPDNPNDADSAKQQAASTGVDPTVLIVVQEATAYPAEMYERGVAVTIADMRANPLDPLVGHKTLNYWGRLRELRAAGTKGAAEALVMQVTNHLSGGCVSNALIVRGDTIITPIARGEEEAATLPAPSSPASSAPGPSNGPTTEASSSIADSSPSRTSSAPTKSSSPTPHGASSRSSRSSARPSPTPSPDAWPSNSAAPGKRRSPKSQASDFVTS